MKARWLCLLIAMLAGGCSPGEPVTTPLVQVHGTVMLDEKPLPNVQVSFFSEEDPDDLIAAAETDGSGRYKLGAFLDDRCERPAKGVLPGSYKVTVSKWTIAYHKLPQEIRELDPLRRDDAINELFCFSRPPLTRVQFGSTQVTVATADAQYDIRLTSEQDDTAAEAE